MHLAACMAGTPSVTGRLDAGRRNTAGYNTSHEAGPLPACAAYQPAPPTLPPPACRRAASSARQQSRVWGRPPSLSTPSGSRWACWAAGGQAQPLEAPAAPAACWAAPPASSARQPPTQRTAMLAAAAAGWTSLWMTSLQAALLPRHRPPSCSPAGAGGSQRGMLWKAGELVVAGAMCGCLC